MPKSNIGEIILYGGGLIILYYILKSWGVIQPMSMNNLNNYNWNPFSYNDTSSLKVEEIERMNPSDIYKDDRFDVRTGRGRMKHYDFVGT